MSLDHTTTMMYLTLRNESKIGRLWTEGENVYKLAPVDAISGFEHQQAEFITVDKLVDLIYSLSGLSLPARIPPQIEAGQIGRLLQARPRIDIRNYIKRRSA